MDNMNVNSKFMRGMLAALLAKVSRTKFGVDPDISFNDPIKIEYGEGKAHLHLNVDIECPQEQFNMLLDKSQF